MTILVSTTGVHDKYLLRGQECGRSVSTKAKAEAKLDLRLLCLGFQLHSFAVAGWAVHVRSGHALRHIPAVPIVEDLLLKCLRALI